MTTLIGPIKQIVTLNKLPLEGPLDDSALEIVENGGILVADGHIAAVGPYEALKHSPHDETIDIPFTAVALPGFVDAHTHICFAGSRASEYALKLRGLSYQEIASKGGGILNTVKQTRAATMEDLTRSMLDRLNAMLRQGVTTCEVKSGYGLTLNDEIKMLEAIDAASRMHCIDVIPTCLAAHTKPKEFASTYAYLEYVLQTVLPQVKRRELARRVDIFVENGAFPVDEARTFLCEARKQGFDITLHANQFSSGGATVAAELHAASADHLEHLSLEEMRLLKDSHVAAVVLPGASLGLGVPFAPARQMLNAGLCVAIASDWNPGSAPMGQMLTQAALLGASQKLTMAETLAAMTFRAAYALRLIDRGCLDTGKIADILMFACESYEEILYRQGALLPETVFKKGKRVG